ncbi:hypothetical protein CR513_50941, partial [Mucuna pruriens]
MWSFSLSASISDVLHVYSSSPLLLTRFSSTHRFPADDTANEHGERKCKGKYHQNSPAKVRGHSFKRKKNAKWPRLALIFWKIDNNCVLGGIKED